jgi:signal recognition particle subunit SRP54
MGSIKDLISMIPGIGNKLKDVDVDTDQLKYIEAIILSMTKKEREKPSIINGSRRRRIANGSGTTVQEVNRLLRQFEDMRKMMKNINKMSKKKGFANSMKGMMPF